MFTVKHYWERAIRDAGIEDFHFHDLRHEATSRMARKLPMHDLMKAVGHKTAVMLERYYHPVPADLAAAWIRQLLPFSGPSAALAVVRFGLLRIAAPATCLA